MRGIKGHENLSSALYSLTENPIETFSSASRTSFSIFVSASWLPINSFFIREERS